MDYYRYPGGRNPQKLTWEELSTEMNVQAKARGIKQRDYNRSKAYYCYCNFVQRKDNKEGSEMAANTISKNSGHSSSSK
jgi:hypothetical protein